MKIYSKNSKGYYCLATFGKNWATFSPTFGHPGILECMNQIRKLKPPVLLSFYIFAEIVEEQKGNMSRLEQ